MRSLLDVPEKVGPEIHVVSAQGDGWVRAYQADTGEKTWEYDTNPKDSVWPQTRNELIATPVVYRDRVFVVSGQDSQYGDGVGYLNVIDVTKRGDSTERGRHFSFPQDEAGALSPGRCQRPALHCRFRRLPPVSRGENRPGAVGA